MILHDSRNFVKKYSWNLNIFFVSSKINLNISGNFEILAFEVSNFMSLKG